MDMKCIYLLITSTLHLVYCTWQPITETCDFEKIDCQKAYGYKINTVVWIPATWSESITDVPKPLKPGPRYVQIRNLKKEDVPTFLIPFENGNGTIEMDIFVSIDPTVKDKQAGIVRLQQGPTTMKTWNSVGTSGNWQPVRMELKPTNVTSSLNLQLTVQRSYRPYVQILIVDNIVLTEWRDSNATIPTTVSTTPIPTTTTTPFTGSTSSGVTDNTSTIISSTTVKTTTYNWRPFPPITLPSGGPSGLIVESTTQGKSSALLPPILIVLFATAVSVFINL